MAEKFMERLFLTGLTKNITQCYQEFWNTPPYFNLPKACDPALLDKEQKLTKNPGIFVLYKGLCRQRETDSLGHWTSFFNLFI